MRWVPIVSATVVQWLRSYAVDHRIYCGYPARARALGRPANRVAAVRGLVALGCHVAEHVPQAVALDRHPLANKVVGFRVRERVA